METPIPNDWDGEWLCVQIQWPDSAQYVGILFGLLTELTRGRFWSADSGSVLDAQAIAWEIHDKNFPLVDCEGEPITPEPETVYIMSGDEDCEDCEMSCSIPYGSIRMNRTTGVLQYLSCGVWYDVEDWEYGVLGDQPDQPDDDNTDPDDPPAPEMNCQKAYWIVHEFRRFMASCLDQMTPTKLVFFWSKDVRSDMAGYSLSNWSLYKMFQATQVAKITFDDIETLLDDTDTAQLVCLFSALLNPDTYAISRAEYDDLRATIATFTNVTARAYMLTAWNALNYSNVQKMTADARGTADYDCECGEILPPPDYDGEVKFTGAVTLATNISWVRNVHTLNNGKILEFDWCPPATDNKEDSTLSFGITTPNPVSSIDIKTSPRTGTDMPTREWQVDPCESLSPSLWTYTDFGGSWTETAVDVVTGAEPSVTWHCVPDTPPATKTSFEYNPRKCPATGGGAKVYPIRLEIVRVNGADV